MKAGEVEAELNGLANPDAAGFAQRFFKTAKGQYGAGDKFLGIKVPVVRAVCKKYKALPLNEIEKLLASPIHEHRLAALVILVQQFKRAEPARRQKLYEFYLAHTSRINNWDLVDLSCRDIVGEYLMDKPRGELYKLAKSADLWERRIAIVSTWQFIRAGQFSDTFKIAEVLLGDEHDLIHKAVGWMLRETGKYGGRAELVKFLDVYAQQMPRTMLRYSIEHFSPAERQHYMQK